MTSTFSVKIRFTPTYVEVFDNVTKIEDDGDAVFIYQADHYLTKIPSGQYMYYITPNLENP